ncbi:hypothetical protein Nepgr_024244 [Nepenthes gracilis]|uniref:Uncharacterized protein n=1 Tax=Nepenthes gracilis TaxID=150966 RepID=A0AAD3T5P6_NEPGR|nr:hypothetical protein Nepgr_024244 [Nepenthes gracilis]
MGRTPCCDKAGVKKGPWSQQEDSKLISFILQHGHDNWRALPRLAGLARCGKSCRLRWVNYLRPDIKRGNFSLEEEETIIKLQEQFGNKWSKIAAQMPGRTDNEIKNVWNTHLKKRLKASNATVVASPSPSPDQKMINDNVDLSSSSSTVDQIGNSDFHRDFNRTTGTVEKQDYRPEDLVEIPFEPNLELWDMLDADCNFADAEVPVIASEDGSSNRDVGSWWWLAYLENELGLEVTANGYRIGDSASSPKNSSS